MTPNHPLVLLVEDNAADAALMTELVEGLRPEVSVVHCPDGEKALAWLNAESRSLHPSCPNLVIMDLRLPGRSGLEILAVLRLQPSTRCLPVVVLSTSDAPRDVDACYRAGANAYLAKSNDPDELGRKVTLAVQLFCHAACCPSLQLGAS
jgi:CheY-like chemotaxis protein